MDGTSAGHLFQRSVEFTKKLTTGLYDALNTKSKLHLLTNEKMLEVLNEFKRAFRMQDISRGLIGTDSTNPTNESLMTETLQ